MPGPFLFNEIGDLGLVEIAAEQPSEIVDAAGIAEQRLGPGAIAAHQAAGMLIGEELITPLQLVNLCLIAADREVAARQMAFGRPRGALDADGSTDLLQRMFGKPAIGGELAAEDVEQRCGTFAFQLQHIVARRLLCLRGTVVIKRPDRRIGPDDIFRLDRLFEIFRRRIAEIDGLLFGDPDILGIGGIVAVGGADQCEVALVGDGEDDAVVGVLKEIGSHIVELLFHDDMAALDEADMMGFVLAEGGTNDMVDPGTGGIDQHAGLMAVIAAGDRIGGLDMPQALLAPCRHDFGARHDGRPLVGGVAGVQHHHPGIVDPAVGIFEGLGKQRLQRLAGRIAAHVEHRGRRQQLAAAKVVVEEEAEPDQPGRTDAALVIGQHEAQRPDDVRRHRPEDFALHQRFAHQAEFVMLEITQAAMDQLGGARRGARGEIVHLRQRHRIAAPNSIARNAAAVDAATDDEYVVNLPAQYPLRAPLQISHRTKLAQLRK